MECTTSIKLTAFVLAMSVWPLANAQTLHGAGDYRENYNQNFETKSLSLDFREKNKKSIDLIANTKKQIGLPPLSAPIDNPLTEEKALLGKKLFFDKRLSLNNTLSCAMCHIPEQGFGSYELKTSVGLEGRSLKRNAPTLYNIAFMKKLFHDAREDSLEWQVWSPLLKKNEMANPSFSYLVNKLNNIDKYKTAFETVFPDEGISVVNIGKAIASYERTLSSASSKFDQWFYSNEKEALSKEQKKGYELFVGKAGCVSCHVVGQDFAVFSDQALHNTGVGFKQSMHSDEDTIRVQISPGEYADIEKKIIDSVSGVIENDLGLYEITQDPKDRWKYRTPTLRNIAITAPYMHNGSLLSLKDVVNFYNNGGVENPLLSPLIKPLNLTEQEKNQLIEFLKSLTGSNVNQLIADAFDHENI